MNKSREQNELKQEWVNVLNGHMSEKTAGMKPGGVEGGMRKIEIVGQAAGHVAQYLNSILSVVTGYSDSVQHELLQHDSLKPYVHQILASSERATLFTRGLLAFIKKQVVKPKATNLNQIVVSVRRLIQRIAGDNIELSTHLSEEDPIVWGDEVQIEQALMNLVTNGRDAMPGGGRLTIRTSVLSFGTGTIESQQRDNPWRCAAVSVSDNGTGMDEPTRKRIFEPFYTTKDAGKAIGLGLPIVDGIVKQHNGSINVISEPGRGTTFTLYFPFLSQTVFRMSLAEVPLTHVSATQKQL